MIGRKSGDDLFRVIRGLIEQRDELERLRYRVRIAEARQRASKRRSFLKGSRARAKSRAICIPAASTLVNTLMWSASPTCLLVLT